MRDQRTVHLTPKTLAALTAHTNGDLEDVLQTLLPNSEHTMSDSSETTDGEPPYEAYITTLEGIDTLAYNLLAAIDDDEALDDTAKSQAKRRVREVRAEIDPLLLAFRHHAGETGDIQLRTRRGPGSESHLGPDPGAFEDASEPTDTTENDDE
ncbi:hypothetical protein [Halostagnicola sp. A-GB9-2]|uniref:hypothetical protein n=1 Tax=Halostagnicola sp. A-GB9-2 TaxID=3048066 RepID=UPI0024C052DC|nr:hypothetical protein [Halostagnicola sp. A-GB9-2]MDJ1434242.1 hypothetical protein [Halostagnicola sp. A-GB9-2]